MDASRYRTYAPLAMILLLATALQAVLWVRLPTISADGIIFTRVARGLSAAPLETMRVEDQHPGFPALQVAATRTLEWFGYREQPQAWMAGGMLVSFVCGVLSIAVVWLFARDLFDVRIANIAAIVFTVLPVPRSSAVDAQSDTPHAFFYLLAAWLATTGLTSGSIWRLAGAGLASGLAFWIRPEGLEVALVAAPFVAWQALPAPWPWRKSALAMAALAGTAFIVATPYMLLAGKITSKQLQFFKPEPAPTYIERLAESETPPPQDVSNTAAKPAPVKAPVRTLAEEPAPAATPAAAPAVAPAPEAEPTYSAKLVASVVALAFAAFINSICQGFKFIFIPFYLLSYAVLFWRRPAGVQVAFVAVLGATHIVILMSVYIFSGYIAHRHVIPLVGLAAPFVAIGIDQTGIWLARLLKAKSAYCTAATLLASCAVVMPYTLRHLNREFVPVIEATQWVNSQLEPGAGIVCNSPYVGYYAGRPVAELRWLSPTLNDALVQAPPARYDFVILHVNAFGYQSEWVEQIESYYEPIREFPDPQTYRRPKKVVVYRVKQGPIRNAALPARP